MPETPTYEVTVYDYNPADGGGAPWDDTFDLRVSIPPQWGVSISDWYNDNLAQFAALESAIRKAALACGQYSDGDRLWWQVDTEECGVMCYRMTV